MTRPHPLSRPSRPWCRAAIALLLLALLFAPAAWARVYLDITSPDLKKLQVAVPYFLDKDHTGEITKQGRAMADLLGRALALHGFIAIIPPAAYNNDRATNWKSVAADYVALGSFEQSAGGLIMEIRFRDTAGGRMVVGKRYRVPAARAHAMLRKFADETIYALTGERGVSNTEIAFVSDASGAKEVYVADILGQSLRQVTKHHWITVSPRFSPNGELLAYTSYHRGNPNLYITNLLQGKTTRAISWRPGLNVCGAWSPDGTSMLATLSKDGNPDIYLLAANGQIRKRYTSGQGINVSATWAPDGKRFAYVSDRSGRPQIYIRDTTTGRDRRLTFSGTENTTPAWSPKGDLIAYTGLEGSNHHIFLISPDGGEPTQLTRYWGEYESPSWSPDGRQLVLTRTRNHKKQLCTIFINEHAVRPLADLPGNQTFPQWSPRLPY